MKKIETVIVPKGKCPLDVLAEMGQRSADAWIFIHKNAIARMAKTADAIGEYEEIELCWNATEKYPETAIVLEAGEFLWHEVYKINAEDISFTYKPEDPKVVLFIKMEE